MEVARAVLALPQPVYGVAFGDVSPRGMTILEAGQMARDTTNEHKTRLGQTSTSTWLDLLDLQRTFRCWQRQGASVFGAMST